MAFDAKGWKLYDKISGPFKRDTGKGPSRNRLILGDWSSDEFKALQDVPWHWTLKIDGTNIRIIWDGHRVTFGGRTDNAQLSAKLIPALEDMFPEEIMEDVFGKSPFTLFGEGYGPGINSGGNYREDQSFILFDVYSYGDNRDNGLFLKQYSVADIANKLGIDCAPFCGWWTPKEAVDNVRFDNFVPAAAKDKFPKIKTHEGVVGRPMGDLRTREGDRIGMKVKTVDTYTSDERLVNG